MSRRGAILQDYGGRFEPQPQDAQLAAASYYQRDKELSAQLGQQKNKDAEADKYRKLKMVDDATDPSKYQSSSQKANSLATQQLLGIRNEFAGKTNLPPDQLYLELQQKLTPVSQGYVTYKSALDEQEALAKKAAETNTNLDLQKVLVDLQTEFDNDYLVKGDDGTASFNQMRIGTKSDALDRILKPENAWKYSKGSQELMDIIKKGGEKGELFSQAPDKTQINYTTNVPFWGQIVDEKGQPLQADPSTGLIPQGAKPRVALKGSVQDYEEVDDRGRRVTKQMIVVPGKTMKAILHTKSLETAFDAEWQKHIMDIQKSNPNFKIDPSTENDAKRIYFSQLLADNGLQQPYVSSRTHLPPQPRTTINNRYGGKDDVTINDVSRKIDDVMKDPLSAINSNGERIGTAMNKLPTDAFNVVVDLVNSKRPEDSKINPDEMFLSDVNGERRVYKIAGYNPDGSQIIKIDNAHLVGILPKTTVNTKANTDTKRKEKVLREGDDKSQSKTFNVVDPSTGKVVLSGVDKTAADKAKAKGYKIQ